MPIAVSKAYSIIDGVLVMEDARKARSADALSDVGAVLTNFRLRGDGPSWGIEVRIGQGPAARTLLVPLQRFLTIEEYNRSLTEPLAFSELGVTMDPHKTGQLNRIWIFRDGVYAAEREPRPQEVEEVVLRIKSIYFQQSNALRKLKEQIATFEAIDSNVAAGSRRAPIPDEVKLLVWSRDGGACVKCGATKELQFDHIIPWSRGGNDTGENLQILCRSCNLAKRARLA